MKKIIDFCRFVSLYTDEICQNEELSTWLICDMLNSLISRMQFHLTNAILLDKYITKPYFYYLRNKLGFSHSYVLSINMLFYPNGRMFNLN